MTIIKQGGVSSKSHQRNLRAYINDDKKVLLRDSQNMEECKDLKRWASYMERTRKTFGHDKAARRIRDRKTGELKEAKNTVLFHQIVAFLPDECDLNGGKLTPEDCMRYARDYVGTYYPNQEVVFALHNEYCKEDKTHRYAVHIVINRSDLSTGKRLDEGRGKEAKVRRASRIRKMDKAWGLKQVERDERNSSVHKKQPSKVEKEIEGRGGESYKMNLRELCRLAADRAENIYEYREMLEGWGVDTQFRKGKLYVTDTDNSKYSFSLASLDADLNANGREDRHPRCLPRGDEEELPRLPQESAWLGGHRPRRVPEARTQAPAQGGRGRPRGEAPVACVPSRCRRAARRDGFRGSLCTQAQEGRRHERVRQPAAPRSTVHG